MICRQTSSTSLALMPGRTARGAGGLGRLDDLEDAGQLALGVRVDAEGARHVGAVALEGGAEVDDDGVAAGDAPAARVVVRLGRVLAGGDDRLEGGALGAAAAHRRIELEGEVLLGDALAHQRQHLEQRGVGDGGGPLHAGDLGRVLDLAQRLDGVGRSGRAGRRRGGRPRCAAPLHETSSASRPMRAAPARREQRSGPPARCSAAGPMVMSTCRPRRPARPAPPTACGSGRRS